MAEIAACLELIKSVLSLSEVPATANGASAAALSSFVSIDA